MGLLERSEQEEHSPASGNVRFDMLTMVWTMAAREGRMELKEAEMHVFLPPFAAPVWECGRVQRVASQWNRNWPSETRQAGERCKSNGKMQLLPKAPRQG